MQIKNLGFRFLMAATLSASMVPAVSYAQAFSSGTDKRIPRLCTNNCVQANERIVVHSNGNAAAVWNETRYNSAGNKYLGLVGAYYTAAIDSWSEPVSFSSSEGYTGEYHLSVAANGRVKAVWVENASYNGYGHHTVFTAEYVPIYAAETAPDIGSWKVAGFGQEYWTTSNVVMGSSRDGYIFVAYRATTTNRTSNITQSRLARYDPATGYWSTDYSNTTPTFDKIIGAEGGGAIGIFYRNGQLQVMRFDTGLLRWVDTRTLEYAAPGVSFSQVEATSDRSGNVMILYERFNSSTNTRQIKSARFQKSTRLWTTKNIPSISASKMANAPAISGDRYGNFYATWIQYSGAYMKTIAARYSGSGGTWSTPRVISTGSYHTRDSTVTNDYAGNAIFAWSQRTDTGTGASTGKVFRNMAVRYSNAVFGTPMVIQDANRIGYKPYIGADNNGRSIVMWTQDSSVAGVKEIRSDRLLPQ